MTLPRSRTIAAALALAAGVPVARADDAPPVVPYRPTVASPADLPAPGWPELEVGGLFAHHGDDERRFSTPVNAKLSLTPEIGIAVGGEAWVRRTGYDGEHASGAGDLVLEAKRRFAVDDTLAYAAEAIVKLPTSSGTIGSGKTDLLLNGILSKDLEGWRIDANLAATRVGAIEEGEKHWGGAWDVAFSHPAGEALTAAAEVFGSARGGTKASSQALASLSWSVTPRFVVDVAVVGRLARNAPDWQVVCGATIGLPRLF